MTQKRPSFPARIDTLGSARVRPLPAATQARTPAASLARAARAGMGTAAAPTPQGLGLDSAAVRARMVQRLAAGGITAGAVLQAMGAVERHRFVDTALVNQAYEDTSLPIGLGQTISKPSVVARMAELLLGAPCAQNGRGLLRILEVGTGCGYQAAVLARLAREVYTVERLRALHEKARCNLRPLRLANVHLLLGDGMLGYAAGAPYDAIISAAGGDGLPQAWCDQLAVGGRLVAPTVGPHGGQALLVVDRTAQGLQQRMLEAVHFVPLKSGIA